MVPCRYEVTYATDSLLTVDAKMVPFYMTNAGGVMCVTLRDLTSGSTYYGQSASSRYYLH